MFAVGLQRLQEAVQEAATGVCEANGHRHRGSQEVQGEDEEDVGCSLRNRKVSQTQLNFF